MKIGAFRNIFYLLITILASACSGDADHVFERHATVSKIGDDPRWAAVDLDDQDWEKDLRFVGDGKIYWSRTPIEIIKAPEALRPYGLELHVYGEYEVYWDGVLIGQNGNPGQELALGNTGKLWTTHSIPIALTQVGKHMLAIRSSLLHFPDHTGVWELEIDDLEKLQTDKLIETSYMHIFAGAFLIVSFYFVFLFITNKQEYPTLIFSICCFLIFALVLTVFSKNYIPMHYSLHVVRLQIINTFLLGISFLIPYYFSMQFPFPRQKPILIVYAVLLLLIYFIKQHAFDLKSLVMVLSMWVCAFGIVVFGVIRNVRGARLVLATLLLSLGIYFLTKFEISVYTGLGLILLGMLYLLSLNIKAQRLAYENSLVQSTRLRLELLKKNIQPHFLMNTLTSLIDWVEESPQKGVMFIEALAKEFDLFNQIEGQKLIPIQQEIALCRAHLEIMGYRKEINYSWEDEGIDAEQKVPPALFHTLLENGITHSLPLQDNSIKFKLTYESDQNTQTYTFLTFVAGIRSEPKNGKEGTGLKYVKARLQESFHSNWELVSEPAPHGWKNVINIHHQPA